MRTSTGRLGAAIGLYYSVAGVALTALGVLAHQWWTSVLGLGLLGMAGMTLFGRGEATSWLRGDLDERRTRAVDHAFRVAFFVLAWWVAAVAVYAEYRSAGTALWVAGNAVALAAAFIDYAWVLHRT